MEEYLEFAKKLSKEAEEIALKYFSFEIENIWKGDNTPLTVADTEINDLVIKKINETYPEHSIYGEERRYDEDGLGCIVSNGILHKEILDIVQTGKL